ncbi:MAG: CAP domain-containing protein [Kofleriaceae bacterium]|nr:CAP domain-containing protein [Kofleriaceae bacterium]
MAEVARAHSREMRVTGVVGHVSALTGSAADRVKVAGIRTGLVLENIARAYGIAEAQAGLMNSPGHRANLLSRAATHVGIGIELGDGSPTAASCSSPRSSSASRRRSIRWWRRPACASSCGRCAASRTIRRSIASPPPTPRPWPAASPAATPRGEPRASSTPWPRASRGWRAW